MVKKVLTINLLKMDCVDYKYKETYCCCLKVLNSIWKLQSCEMQGHEAPRPSQPPEKNIKQPKWNFYFVFSPKLLRSIWLYVACIFKAGFVLQIAKAQ